MIVTLQMSPSSLKAFFHRLISSFEPLRVSVAVHVAPPVTAWLSSSRGISTSYLPLGLSPKCAPAKDFGA